MEVVTFEQVISSSNNDAENKSQAVTAKSSGVVGRILELKKRRQQLSGMLLTSPSQVYDIFVILY